MFVHLFIQEATGEVTVTRGSNYTKDTFDGVTFHHFTTYLSEPVFPERTFSVWNATIKGVKLGSYNVGWQAVTEDGVYPAKDTVEMFTLTVGHGPATIKEAKD